MFSVPESSLVLGISELRIHAPKLIAALGSQAVYLTRRNQPQAVLLSLAEYDRLCTLAEEREDRDLLEVVKKRTVKKKSEKNVSHAQVKKILGIK